MAARRSWDSLTPAYRARLERQGITRESHANADLTTARGHRSSPPGSVDRSLPGRQAYDRVVHGQGTEDDWQKLPSLFLWPDWVPRNVHRQPGEFPTQIDVAAALSQFPDPKKWRSVSFTPHDDGRPWEMTVELQRGYPRTFLIPGGGGPGSGAKEILEIVTEIHEQRLSEQESKRRKIDALFFSVTEST